MKTIETRTTAPDGRIVITTAEVESDFLDEVTARGALGRELAARGHRLRDDPLAVLCDFLAEPARTLIESN